MLRNVFGQKFLLITNEVGDLGQHDAVIPKHLISN